MFAVRTLVLSIVFALFVIDCVSSTKCYECQSDVYGDCYQNPAREYLKDCDDYSAFGRSSNNSKSSKDPFMLRALFNESIFQGDPKSLLDTDCATLQATMFGEIVVFRSCAPKFATCDFIKLTNPTLGKKVEICDRCDFDYCNESANVTSSFWTVAMMSLILIYCRIRSVV